MGTGAAFKTISWFDKTLRKIDTVLDTVYQSPPILENALPSKKYSKTNSPWLGNLNLVDLVHAQKDV